MLGPLVRGSAHVSDVRGATGTPRSSWSTRSGGVLRAAQRTAQGQCSTLPGCSVPGTPDVPGARRRHTCRSWACRDQGLRSRV
ncbi:hypothetical protein SGUI_1468 [Serinicoccus hydrothermalis]|uniref:Uncharacterized protein n=1 Tax=Serinicoccus hydrothermalis TaxID=1758689 RepID=A0A1B1NBT6_9MICO|nr:hypothetical protein SGUI_1468 [Serinicoccus hydrothermalis]